MNEYIQFTRLVVSREMWIQLIYSLIIKCFQRKVIAMCSRPKLYLLWKALHLHDKVEAICPCIHLEDGTPCFYTVFVLFEVEFTVGDRPELHLAVLSVIGLAYSYFVLKLFGMVEFLCQNYIFMCESLFLKGSKLFCPKHL